MSYDPTIPKAVDRPSASQQSLLINFSQLNTQFGVEHSSLRVGAGNGDGKHKYVTLKRSAGVLPVGTDLILAQALTPAGNPYVQIASPTYLRSIPLNYTTPVAIHIPAGSGDRNLIDFAALGFVPQAGTVLGYDTVTKTRINFSPFSFDGATIWLPPGTTGQLSSGGTGGTFAKFVSAGSVLQMETHSVPAGGLDILVFVTGTAL